jgi:hypothetical protein
VNAGLYFLLTTPACGEVGREGPGKWPPLTPALSPSRERWGEGAQRHGRRHSSLSPLRSSRNGERVRVRGSNLLKPLRMETTWKRSTLRTCAMAHRSCPLCFAHVRPSDDRGWSVSRAEQVAALTPALSPSRTCGAHNRRDRDSACRQMRKVTTRKFHGVPPQRHSSAPRNRPRAPISVRLIFSKRSKRSPD